MKNPRQKKTKETENQKTNKSQIIELITNDRNEFNWSDTISMRRRQRLSDSNNIRMNICDNSSQATTAGWMAGRGCWTVWLHIWLLPDRSIQNSDFCFRLVSISVCFHIFSNLVWIYNSKSISLGLLLELWWSCHDLAYYFPNREGRGGGINVDIHGLVVFILEEDDNSLEAPD